jgi:hypothetical protein
MVDAKSRKEHKPKVDLKSNKESKVDAIPSKNNLRSM